MKATLFAVGCMALLDDARLSPSALPDSSTLILSFNELTAGWRFNLPAEQLSMLARGPHHSSSSIQEIFRPDQIQDDWFNSLSLTIQQKPNARINRRESKHSPLAAKIDDERLASRASG
jgi:hypothetical protein